MRNETWLACGLALALAAPADGVDGVVEINQASALAGGITPGDAPGFPVTLSATGSYRLTSNLSPGAAIGALGIEIAADSVSIDLNAFAIIGTNVCTGFPVTSCSGPNGNGVSQSAATFGARVMNGTIRGMGNGLSLRSTARVSGVLAIGNSNYGILVGPFSAVVDSVAAGNGGRGIEALGDSIVRGNEVHANGGDGIRVDARFLVSNNNVYLNGDAGISLDTPGLARENVVTQNNWKTNQPNLVLGGIKVWNVTAGSRALLSANVMTDNRLANLVGGGVFETDGTNVCGSALC